MVSQGRRPKTGDRSAFGRCWRWHMYRQKMCYTFSDLIINVTIGCDAERLAWRAPSLGALPGELLRLPAQGRSQTPETPEAPEQSQRFSAGGPLGCYCAFGAETAGTSDGRGFRLDHCILEEENPSRFSDKKGSFRP
ncbi:hypothetical protein PG999_003253 [Apiospora kogelbergensis]|uniref:Uncharacterized protein n=1 Tax=Apiospora kogelbergensis TaxID=1337665 RepID=A0AAW0R2Z6_9PEZI